LFAGEVITTVSPFDGTSDGLNGNGTAGGNGTTGDGGDGGDGDDGGGGLSTAMIAGIVAGLAVLALLLLILCCWLLRRRKKDDGRPYSVAFYQPVRAGRPAKLGCHGKDNAAFMMGGYRPRSIDRDAYCHHCGPGNCFSPHYNQHSMPVPPIRFY